MISHKLYEPFRRSKEHQEKEKAEFERKVIDFRKMAKSEARNFGLRGDDALDYISNAVNLYSTALRKNSYDFD